MKTLRNIIQEKLVINKGTKTVSSYKVDMDNDPEGLVTYLENLFIQQNPTTFVKIDYVCHSTMHIYMLSDKDGKDYMHISYEKESGMPDATTIIYFVFGKSNENIKLCKKCFKKYFLETGHGNDFATLKTNGSNWWIDVKDFKSDYDEVCEIIKKFWRDEIDK